VQSHRFFSPFFPATRTPALPEASSGLSPAALCVGAGWAASHQAQHGVLPTGRQLPAPGGPQRGGAGQVCEPGKERGSAELTDSLICPFARCLSAIPSVMLLLLPAAASPQPPASVAASHGWAAPGARSQVAAGPSAPGQCLAGVFIQRAAGAGADKPPPDAVPRARPGFFPVSPKRWPSHGQQRPGEHVPDVCRAFGGSWGPGGALGPPQGCHHAGVRGSVSSPAPHLSNHRPTPAPLPGGVAIPVDANSLENARQRPGSAADPAPTTPGRRPMVRPDANLIEWE